MVILFFLSLNRERCERVFIQTWKITGSILVGLNLAVWKSKKVLLSGILFVAYAYYLLITEQ